MADEAVCERDGAVTRLRCSHCDAGICPACLVRTPVGYKCRTCAGDGRPPSIGRRAGLYVLAGVTALAALVGVVLLRSPGPTGTNPVAVESVAVDVPASGQAMMGEEARDGQLVFVVGDFGCAPRPASTGNLCTLRFTVKNDSSSPAMLLGRFQYLVDGQSRTYGADEALTRVVPENDGRSLSELNINPAVVVPMALVFELPAGVEPSEARFRGTGRSRFGVNVRLQRRP